MKFSDANLGNQVLLNKIDRLRETNVGAIIPLPQLVVVGDQSSGKSSVLESLTGFAFPRAAGLCTRYATQITCSREALARISITIIPRPGADDALKERLVAFHRQMEGMNNETLAQIFKEANAVMGIRTNTEDDSYQLSAFSEDILRVEISGPDQAHLTVIDVPGIFRIETPGLTTQSDVALVRNVVRQYIENPRTIILAVMPCNVDIATQEILKLAEEADPDGLRTMGVLTKPDLAIERATQDAVVNLVQGRQNQLKLGYFVIKNLSADDNASTPTDRLAAEQAFFMAPPWSLIADRCGISSLQSRLRDLLMEITKRELPHVKSEIEKRSRECKDELTAIGEPRADESSQRQYLVRIASHMQDITKSALNGYYAGEPLFKAKPDLRLITRMTKLNEAFANVFWKRGHYQHFEPTWTYDGESTLGDIVDELPSDVPLDAYSEIQDIIGTNYVCPKPLKGPMTTSIREVYDSSRGPELGTFNGALLAAVFDKASQKWEPLVESYISKAIVLVHDYVRRLLDELCPDEAVRESLWNDVLEEELCIRYRRAMAHARFLVKIERTSTPLTYNHYFNANLQKKRQDRMRDSLEGLAININNHEGKYISLEHIGRHAIHKDNSDQICDDISDALQSYYKVSRKRFVDVLCQQVVDHMLLNGTESPLRVMCADRMLRLSSDQLEMIAGEAAASRDRRQALARDLDSLQKAMKVLRV